MEIFCVTAPGLEHHLADECRELGFEVLSTSPGGVSLNGDWPDVARANRLLRGAVRVLARLATFRAVHLAQLDKRSRKLPWADWFPAGSTIKVDAVCRKSRIYHRGAAAQRITTAVQSALGPVDGAAPHFAVKLRIEDDLCTVSVDTSGESLHKRGLKQQVNKAPMRETMAALFLRACGFDRDEPVYDPMCGSGTFPIEAAEIALGHVAGRARHFAFENLLPLQDHGMPDDPPPRAAEGPVFFGSDRDQGAIHMSQANSARAGVADVTNFFHAPISDIAPPCNRPGLVIVNPPYGGRVGKAAPLFGLYTALGQRLTERFAGWRVGLVTSEAGLARATGLKWSDTGPIVDHGGIKIRLWQSQVH